MTRSPARVAPRLLTKAEAAEYPPYTKKDVARAVEGAAMAGIHMRGEITSRGSIRLTRVEERDDRRMGIVYFFRVNDFVKIGFTNNIKARLKTLQTGSPYKFELAWFEEGSDLLERYYHALFDSYRVDREWFRVRGRLATFLKRRAA